MASNLPQRSKLSFMFRLILCFIISTSVVFTTLSIVCNSKWAKTKLTRQLERLIPGQWTVAAVYVDHLLRLHIVDVRHAEFKIKKVSISPNLDGLATGEIRLKSIKLESVTGTIDLSNKWKMTEIASSNAFAFARNQELGLPATHSVTEIMVSDSEMATSQLIQRHAISLRNRSNEKRGDLRELSLDLHGAWLIINGMNLSCHWSGAPFLSIQDINAEVPISGSDLIGEISWKGASVQSLQVMGASSVRLEKTQRCLSLEETNLEVLSVRLEPNLGIVNTNNGLHFIAEVHVPDQAFEQEHYSFGSWQMRASAERLAGRFQVVGPIFKPELWRGRYEVVAQEIEASKNNNNETVSFDSFNLAAKLESGSLMLQEYSLLGEQFSFRGNGSFDIDGTGYGVLRVMAPAQQSRWIDGLYNNVLFGRQRDIRVMSPLSGEDLEYTDIYFDGALWSPSVKFNKSSQWNQLWPVFMQGWNHFMEN